MAYSAMALANAFIQRAEEGRVRGLTPMKLQKLMFFTQSWHLKLYNGILIDDIFCRWPQGPVIPSLYHEFRRFGGFAITEYARYVRSGDEGYEVLLPVVRPADTRAWALIDEVIRVYGEFSGPQLSNLIHMPGTAWTVGAADAGPILNELLAERVTVCSKQ